MSRFTKEFYSNSKSFCDVYLTGCPDSFTFSGDTFLGKMIDGILTYIDKRFEVFRKVPLSMFHAFNYRCWPSDRTMLASHSNKDVAVLCDHFSAVLTEEEKQTVSSQFHLLKARVKAAEGSVLNTYTGLLQSRPPALTSILKIVELVLVMSPSTAICERLFSSMNLVKTDRRTTLRADTLQDLLNITEHGPIIEDFYPLESVNHWLRSTAGSRHVNGHRILNSTHCSCVEIMEEECG